MKCFQKINETKDEIPPNWTRTNFDYVPSWHESYVYDYYCSMCGEGSNGYVEMEVPEGCLVVLRGEEV